MTDFTIDIPFARTTRNYDEFITQVRYRAELGSRAEAVRTTRATLKTLGERLQSDEANDLASSLLTEIDRFVTTAESGQSFEYSEFVERVVERAETDSSEACFYAKVVMDVLDDAFRRKNATLSKLTSPTTDRSSGDQSYLGSPASVPIQYRTRQ